MNKVSCIIPAYNEEPRISHVLDVVSKHSLINEIIVIDDKSSDDTENKVLLYPTVTLLCNKKNYGKSFSIARGIEASAGEYLLFLDADLIGISENDITDLISPVLDKAADVSISLRRNSPFIWRLIGLDYLSGERVIPKKVLISKISELKQLPRFGLEVFMNEIIKKNRYKIKIVRFNEVDSPYKYKKYGLLKGLKGDAGMMRDIFKTISPIEALSQICSMLKLKI